MKYPVSFVFLFHRAATIVLREDNCHFLRVDKENFNRILRDVEANTVRLKEHGKDVLVLEKISSSHNITCSHFKYVSPRLICYHLCVYLTMIYLMILLVPLVSIKILENYI
jgi:hypothetical protein